MSIGTYIAIYFIVWWTILFAVLPWGVRTQAEENQVSPGTEPSAPARPLLLRKAIATSVVAAVITLGLFWVSSVVSLEDFPMPFKTDER